jgi:hypothetical protein
MVFLLFTTQDVLIIYLKNKKTSGSVKNKSRQEIMNPRTTENPTRKWL